MCIKYLTSKSLYAESYYRNASQYLNRPIYMIASGIWGIEIENSVAAILFNIDIFVELGYTVAKWQLFSQLEFDLSNAYEFPKEGIYPDCRITIILLY